MSIFLLLEITCLPHEKSSFVLWSRLVHWEAELFTWLKPAFTIFALSKPVSWWNDWTSQLRSENASHLHHEIRPGSGTYSGFCRRLVLRSCQVVCVNLLVLCQWSPGALTRLVLEPLVYACRQCGPRGCVLPYLSCCSLSQTSLTLCPLCYVSGSSGTVTVGSFWSGRWRSHGTFWVLAQLLVPCPSLHERIYLTSFSTSVSPGIGKEGSQLENTIQDLFPFRIKQLHKTFTDVLCVREPLPKENQRVGWCVADAFHAAVWLGWPERTILPAQAVSQRTC